LVGTGLAYPRTSPVQFWRNCRNRYRSQHSPFYR